MNKPTYKPYLLAFVLGVVSGIWLLPPTPSPELSDYDRNQIMYELLDHLEQNDFNVRPAKENITRSKSWFF